MNPKKILAFIAVATAAISCKKDSTPSNTANIHLNKDLVAYYPFNGNVKDESGNGNNGTLLNKAYLTYDERGFDTSALNCADNNDGVLVKNIGKFNFDTAITVSFNTMLRSHSGNAIVTFANYENNTAQKISIGTINEGYFGAQVANSNDICSIVATDPVTKPYRSVFANQIYQPIEHWYNVIVVINKGQGYIYMNGVLQGTGTFASTTFNVCSSADLLIGAWTKAAPASGTDGIIDEVRIYNRVLNNDEITELATYVSK